MYQGLVLNTKGTMVNKEEQDEVPGSKEVPVDDTGTDVNLMNISKNGMAEKEWSLHYEKVRWGKPLGKC